MLEAPTVSDIFVNPIADLEWTVFPDAVSNINSPSGSRIKLPSIPTPPSNVDSVVSPLAATEISNEIV